MTRIAVIEDSSLKAKLLKGLFEGLGHDLSFFTSKAEDLPRLQEFQPQVIFCPRTPAHKTGSELCRQLRRDSLLKQPAMVITTTETTEPLGEGWEMGDVDSLLLMPATPEKISACLAALPISSTDETRKQPLAVIIDDGKVARAVLKRELESLGFRVESADDGHSGIVLVNQLRPDLVLTDVEMPGVSGYQVCEILASNPLTAKIPVVVVSGTVNDQEIRKGFHSGAIDFLAKPVDSKTLAATVSTLLGRAQRTFQGTAVVLEEDPRTASIISKLFSDRGLRALICNTPQELDAYLSISTPDIMLLGIRSSDGTGPDLCRHLREKIALQAIPLVIISSAVDKGDMVECLRSGASDFISQPFAKEEFNARIAIHLRTKHLQDELAKKVQIMESLAYHDTLTGLMNRRFLEDGLKREIERAKRTKTSLAAIMIDLDHFKAKNDTYGHAIGDQILSGVAAIVKSSVRLTDLPCRYGGEEMCILLPGTDIEQAGIVAERIRSNCERNRFTDAGLVQTASLGVSAFPSLSEETSLVADADSVLYVAKKAGRNKVIHFHPSMAEEIAAAKEK